MPALYAGGEQQRQAQLDAGNAIGDLMKARIGSGREFAGFIVSIGGVVGREDLKGAVGQAPPHGRVGARVPGRRAAAHHCALGAGKIQILGGQEEILRARLAVDFQSAALGTADFIDGLGGGYVHDEHRHIHEFGQANSAVGRFSLSHPGMADGMVFWLTVTTAQ